MSILNNALNSIAIGLEDFESPDERRMISSVRNIFAGILLLFKHRLCELSPEGSDEVLIKQKILPSLGASGELNWTGKGNKTVDVQNIKERFDSLKISVDWGRLEKINKYRNEIEHYYSTLKSESVQSLISDSFIIIRDFIAHELKKDPKLLLGEDYWKILVEVNEVYAKEKYDCSLTLQKLSYLSNEILHALEGYCCSKCGSDLIEAEGANDATNATFKCHTCDYETNYEDIINDALSDYYARDIYFSLKDGGDSPLIDCPSCIDGTYIFSENICASCGYSASHVCSRCGCNIPPEEISEDDLCGYCSHMLERLMAE